MTDRSDLFRRMREALATTFPRRQNAELIAADAGLDLSRVDWSGSAQAFWRDILEDAEQTGRVDSLLKQAVQDAPAIVELAGLQKEYRAWSEASQAQARRLPVTEKPAPRPRWLWPTVGGTLGLLVVVAAIYAIVSSQTARPTPTSAATDVGSATATTTTSLPAVLPTTAVPQATAVLSPAALPTTTVPEATAAPALALTTPSVAGATATGLNDTVLIWIPAGEFTMGSTELDPQAYIPERPQHKVSVAGFWIMRTEVTNAEYLRCVQADACTTPANKDYVLPEYEQYPVTDVDWYQANAYAHWVGGRLPTEAEWEKACRGSDVRIYPWGDSAPTDAFARYYGPNGADSAVEVGSYPKGASPYGLLDMAGNVREWTSSLWGENPQIPGFKYPYDATDGREDQAAPGAILRVMRGGYFLDGEGYLRCAARRESLPNAHDWSIGFRVVVPG